MNIAEEHFQKLSQSESFRKAYLEESIKFDFEMKLNLLKDDIKNNRSSTTVLKKIKSLENLIKKDFHLSYS
jgi:hypothetical protein